MNDMQTESHNPMPDPDEIVSGLEEWVRMESPTCSVEGVNAMMDLASNAMRFDRRDRRPPAWPRRIR